MLIVFKASLASAFLWNLKAVTELSPLLQCFPPLERFSLL